MVPVFTHTNFVINFSQQLSRTSKLRNIFEQIHTWIWPDSNNSQHGLISFSYKHSMRGANNWKLHTKPETRTRCCCDIHRFTYIRLV